MNKNKQIFRTLVTLLTILMLLGGVSTFPADMQAAGGQAVIVQGLNADHAAALVTQYGGEVTSRLDIIDGVGARVPAGALAALRQAPGIVRVSPNAPTQLTASSFGKKVKNTPESDYPNVTGADLAWASGALGNGVTVAVVDTGIARQHTALKDNLSGKKEKVIGWVDFVEGKQNPVDPNGHGTHIAGIIGNASLGSDGEYNGMAPGANLVGVRVLDKTGAGDYEKVIQGHSVGASRIKITYNIKVMNLSLYSLVQSPYWADPLNQAVMRAWAEGITVVVAAGNYGPQAMSISGPGNTSLCHHRTGAFTDAYTPNDWNDDYLAESFSAAGPTLDGFVKPDLLAPGAHMVSTMMPGSYIARNQEANWVEGQYFSMAGTSQSAAVVSGAAAQILSQNPSLTPDQVKYRLMVTALPWINTEFNGHALQRMAAGRRPVERLTMRSSPKTFKGSANRAWMSGPTERRPITLKAIPTTMKKPRPSGCMALSPETGAATARLGWRLWLVGRRLRLLGGWLRHLGRRATAPGLAVTAPGLVATAPGLAVTAPGPVATAPGPVATVPGRADTAPGPADTIDCNKQPPGPRPWGLFVAHMERELPEDDPLPKPIPQFPAAAPAQYARRAF
jgi:subtilisin family serine protease